MASIISLTSRRGLTSRRRVLLGRRRARLRLRTPSRTQILRLKLDHLLTLSVFTFMKRVTGKESARCTWLL
jgi:hypothetical protein